jgi:hypothetical protein
MSWFLLQSSLLFWLCRLRIEHALLLGGFAGAPVPQTGLLRACVETVLLHTRQIPVDRQLL